jgi:hypothetical protein
MGSNRMSLFHAAVQPALDDNGAPISGAVWEFYASGGLTPLAVYADAEFDTSLGSAVTANAAGNFDDIYINDAVPTRAILKTGVGGTTRKDIDPVDSSLSSASHTFLQAGDDAVIRTVQDKLRDTISAKDFGVVADGVTDDAPTLQAAVDFAAGREIQIPAGTVRLASPITDHRIATLESDDIPGLNMRGAGTLATILEFDFDGDYGISVRGTDQVEGKFQKGGGLKDLTIRPAEGRTITSGLKIVGWWIGSHSAADFGGFTENREGRGFTYGVHFPIAAPTAGGSYDNPDDYQSTKHSWIGCGFRCNTTGVYAETGQGSAIQTFENCALTHNLEHGAQFHGSNWTFRECDLAFNGLGGVTGYGAYLDATSSSVTNLLVEGCEIDSNLTAGLYIGFCGAAQVERNRFISKRMEDNNGVSHDFQLTHVYLPPSLITTIRAVDNDHRIDTIGFTDPVQSSVTLYDGGSGTVNISGCDILGVRLGGISGFISGTITNGSPTVTGLSASAFNGLQTGQLIKDSQQRIPYGTAIQALDSGAGTLTMTANATSSAGPINLRVFAEHIVASAGLRNPRYHNFVRESPGRPHSSRRTDMCLTGTSTQAFTNTPTAWVFAIENTGFTEAGIVDPNYESATGGIRVTHMGKTRVRVRFTLSTLVAGDTFTVRLKKNGSAVTGEAVTGTISAAVGNAPYELTFIADHDIGDLLQLEIEDHNNVGTAGHAVVGTSRMWAEAF